MCHVGKSCDPRLDDVCRTIDLGVVATPRESASTEADAVVLSNHSCEIDAVPFVPSPLHERLHLEVAHSSMHVQEVQTPVHLGMMV